MKVVKLCSKPLLAGLIFVYLFVAISAQSHSSSNGKCRISPEMGTEVNEIKRMLTNEAKENENQLIPAASSRLSRLQMFNLTIDCFEELFDFLSAKDLNAFGRTSEMKKIAGDYFREHIAMKGFISEESNGIELRQQYKRFDLPNFNQFIKYVHLFARGQPYGLNFIKCPNKHNFDKLQSIESNIDQSAINHIEMYAFHLNHVNTERIRNILGKVETVSLRCCLYSGDFYDAFLKFCGNLKRLDVNRSDLGPVHKRAYKVEEGEVSRYQEEDENVRNGNVWMHYNYTKLEYLTLIPFEKEIVSELNDFLDRHPNIHTFATSTSFIRHNREQLLRSNAKFDVFFVKRSGGPNDEHFEETCEIIKQLHARGFYKRLHFDIGNNGYQTYTLLATLPGLKKMNDNLFGNGPRVSNFFNLTNLKELSISSAATPEDLETLTIKLQKLEKVYLQRKSYDTILPFIRCSKNLKVLKVFFDDFNGDLNLFELNKEREKLTGAQKLQIYVPEDIYLKTKWNAPNGDTNLSLIEMKRYDLFEWNYIE